MTLQDLIDKATENGRNQVALNYDLVWENVSECAEVCSCCMETSNIHINVNDATIWIQNGEDR
jgi:hypothetical protein